MSALDFIKDRIWPPAQITTSFANKTVIVTGSNTGLGFEAALKYAELGASTVVLAVRSMEKGQRAKEVIEEKTHRLGVIKVWKLEMDSYFSIQAFAERVDREIAHLDVALLNAGVGRKKYKLSPEGWEETLQVNVLSTALLSFLLLPKLMASKTSTTLGHLTIVSSRASVSAKPKSAEKSQRIQTYNTAKGYSMTNQYTLPKLFVMCFTRELAKHSVAADGEPHVIINDVCPGGCRTDLLRDLDSGFVGVAKAIPLLILFKTAEQGSRAMVRATLSGKESHGKYRMGDVVGT